MVKEGDESTRSLIAYQVAREAGVDARTVARALEGVPLKRRCTRAAVVRALRVFGLHAEARRVDRSPVGSFGFPPEGKREYVISWTSPDVRRRHRFDCLEEAFQACWTAIDSEYPAAKAEKVSMAGRYPYQIIRDEFPMRWAVYLNAEDAEEERNEHALIDECLRRRRPKAKKKEPEQCGSVDIENEI